MVGEEGSGAEGKGEEGLVLMEEDGGKRWGRRKGEGTNVMVCWRKKVKEERGGEGGKMEERE